MKKISVVTATEAAVIIGCGKSNIDNIARRKSWHSERRKNFRYFKLADVCQHAGCSQKKGLSRVAKIRANGPSVIKIEWPEVGA